MALAIALSLGNRQGSTSSTSIETTQQQSTAPVTPQMDALSEDEILEQVLKLSLTEK